MYKRIKFRYTAVYIVLTYYIDSLIVVRFSPPSKWIFDFVV